MFSNIDLPITVLLRLATCPHPYLHDVLVVLKGSRILERQYGHQPLFICASLVKPPPSARLKRILFLKYGMAISNQIGSLFRIDSKIEL